MLMKNILATICISVVVTVGSIAVRADQVFSVIEVYCGEREGLLDIIMNLRPNFHFLYEGNTERFIWTQDPMVGKFECQLGNNRVTLNYEQLGDPMVITPRTWPWLTPPTPEEIAKYIPYDLKFEILINDIQYIKPTAIIKDCGLPERPMGIVELFRLSIVVNDNYGTIIRASRIGNVVRSDHFDSNYDKRLNTNFPLFCF